MASSRTTDETGAASAVPVIVIPKNATVAEIDRREQMALNLIDAVQDLDTAEALLAQVTLAEQAARLAKVSADREQRWRALKLRAERKYGELLGPPVDKGGGRRTVTSSHSDRKRTERARKIAAVPEAEFEDYILSESKPTREGLLREKAAPPKEPKKTTKTDTSPIGIADRLRERIGNLRGADSKNRHWRDADLDDVESLVRVIHGSRAKYSSKRLHDLSRKRGSRIAQFEYKINRLVGLLEQFDVTDYELADPYEVEDLVEDLMSLQIWMDQSLALAVARLSDDAFEAKLAKMRDPSGRTKHEHRTSLALADKLEQRRRNHALTV